MAKPKILIVEDEFSLAEMYKTKFEKEGFQVILADSVDRGLSLARCEKPDLILLDILFSIKSGYEMLKELKEDINLRKIPVVILSNLPRDSVFKPEQKELLADIPYLVKTYYTPSEVVKFVRKFLKEKK